MLGNLTERIQASQNKFEKLVARLPGYAGYKKKEERREADKLLRLHVARQYEEQLARLNGLQAQFTDRGDLRMVLALEQAVIKLQLLIDRLKTASYGYAGLFDAVKVDEAALDRLYAFDEAMLTGEERLTAALDALAGAAGLQQVPTPEARALVALLEELNATYSQRQDALLG